MATFIGITGTGTGIGKTALAAALGLWGQKQGLATVYCKPVQCGQSPLPTPGQMGGDADWIRMQLARLPSALGPLPTFNLVNLKQAASPHLAAKNEGLELSLDAIGQGLLSLAQSYSIVLVEGAGGAAVPFHRKGWTLMDLALPIQWIVASSPGVGTLHQTRATVEFMRAQKAHVAGFAFCHAQAEASSLTEDNRETLMDLLDLPCLAELPFAPSWESPKGLNSSDAVAWEKALSSLKPRHFR